MLQEINSNFKELAIFPSRIKVLILESFQGLQTQFQSQRLVMLWSVVFVTADGKISPESFYVTKQT